MSLKPHIIYAHGLGSGPNSQKGISVRDYFSPRGYSVSLPSISVPSLEQLSPVAAVRLIQQEVVSHRRRELIVIGSSFGAFIVLHALHALSEGDRGHVTRLVLLAPALDPWDPNSQLLSPDRERMWREKGTAPIFDIERGHEVAVHYRFVEELRGFVSCDVNLAIPTLLIHGLHDDVVSVSQSRDFASKRPSVTLEIVQDTHQLLANPQKMMESIERFILSGSTDSL